VVRFVPARLQAASYRAMVISHTAAKLSCSKKLSQENVARGGAGHGIDSRGSLAPFGPKAGQTEQRMTAQLLKESPRTALERVPGSQLQLARVRGRVRTDDLAESPLIYLFVRIGEIGVVEDVERVKTDL
jgi:hypothetical protein